MKKILIAMLALVLCLAFTLTGCLANKIEENNPEANGAPDAATEDIKADPTNKDLLKDIISADALANSPLASLEISTEDILAIASELALKGEVTVAFDGVESKAEAAIKDNQFYCALYQGTEVLEAYYARISEEILELYTMYGGIWSMGEAIDINDYIDQLIGMTNSSMGVEFGDLAVTDVKVPELKDEYLTEKDGMIVIDVEYFVDLYFANLGLVAGNEEVPAEELEAAKADVLELADQLGLEIAVQMGAKEITKIALSIAPKDEDFPIGAASIVAAATPDGKNLELIEAKLSMPYDAYGIEYTLTYGVKLESVIVNDEIVGFKLDAEVTAPTIMAKESFAGGADATEIRLEREAIFQKMNLSASVDISKLDTAGADVVDFKFSMGVDKAYQVVEKIDVATGEHTIDSLVEKDVAEYANGRIEANASFKTVDENTVAIGASVTAAGKTVTVNGTLTVGEFDFPVAAEDIIG